MLKNINLQLFADPKPENVEEPEEESAVSVDEPEEKPEESEEPVEEPEEPEEEPEAKPVKKDKVTNAVIREKQENKKLRERLAALEKEKSDREQESHLATVKQRYIDAGYPEEEAEERARDKMEREELKRELRDIKYNQQIDKLAEKYPDIHEHRDSFISLVEASKGALTLAELCKAKLDEATTYEIRTKAEQETLLQKQKAKDKQIKTGEIKNTGGIKFSPQDEEAYQFYASKNPGKTRSDYQKIIDARKG